MKAAARGHIDIVKQLLDAGIDSKEVDGRGNTALFWAALNGKSNIVKLLIKSTSALTSISISSPLTPVMGAVYSGNMETLKILLEASRALF